MINIAENLTVIHNKTDLTKNFGRDASGAAHSFHKTFPDYNPTPLIELNGLANQLSVKNIWLKDESHRFGLNAFKVLGASYAVAKLFAEMFGVNEKELSYSIFTETTIREKTKDLTLVTATDGNHGRGVAWTAKQIGCKSVVYMPKGTKQSRSDNIKSLGADVYIIDGNYDDASYLARENAEKFGWILVQDSSWEGYEKIPLWIMQGYLTLMHESFEQLSGEIPTHFFVQCGVGSLPAAVQAYLVNQFGNDRPLFAIVEPNDAACVYESFVAGDGNVHTLTNEIHTIMAGLACGTPSKLAWEIMRDYSNYFITCDDEVTKSGMDILAKGTFGDDKIISGESGAVTTGLIHKLLSDSAYRQLTEKLKLNSDTKIFLISTEGDTDPKIYKKITQETL